MAATKEVNYTPEMTEKLVAGYKAGTSVEELAVMFGKSVRSVTAKLVREGAYVKKEYVGKTGEKPVKKEALATEFMELCGLTEAEADSLAKANKTALAKVLAALKA